jgi:hypothetical protein
MPRRNIPHKPTIPADIKARRKREVEQAEHEQQRAKDEKETRYQLVRAGNLAETLGQAYELEQKTDKDYLGRWVNAIAAYKAVLSSWPNPNVPPAGITAHNRDARRVAEGLFLASDTKPDKAVKTLAKIATDDPDFAVSVARWLRHEIRKEVEGYWLDPPIPTPTTSSRPVDENKPLVNEDNDEDFSSALGKTKLSTIFWLAVQRGYVDQGSDFSANSSEVPK